MVVLCVYKPRVLSHAMVRFFAVHTGCASSLAILRGYAGGAGAEDGVQKVDAKR